jgi:hypothetical protein
LEIRDRESLQVLKLDNCRIRSVLPAAHPRVNDGLVGEPG